ncbi:ATP-binding cassette domain-containing protein [Paenibacillus gansuensis]|uniref:ATP-binding cassette domain-containing protein n=1 Tax=Paenibacillus gansuensis TaxID=306542 RepID=A0ABW5PKP7_9BACL
MASPLRKTKPQLEGHLGSEAQVVPVEAVRTAPHQAAHGADRGTAIHVEGVSKTFGSKQVLHGLNLTVQSGEFVAIVGRSGCGKSTLLRLLAGLEEAAAGTLALDGRPVRGIHPLARVMFQDARLLPWKSVLDNVKIGVTADSKREAHEQALEALKLVGLEDRAHEWPSVLSGGQRQRVSLARALVGRPKLLLLDEPLGALDALTRIEMQRFIERLWTQQGFTALLVTHDVSEAVALADRVILIEEGSVALDLPVQLSRPREKDSGFSHYEKAILDRVLQPEQLSPQPRNKDHYEI